MTAQTAEKPRDHQTDPMTGGDVAIFQKPRLSWHPAFEEKFGDLGVTKETWKALVEAVFPLASSPDSIAMALSYCKARGLDPFKRVVHIVPMWHGQLRKLVDTVWPGIAELRTTAFRTGSYAGKDAAEWGPEAEVTLADWSGKVPEWCRVTVYRMVKGTRCKFVGPQVFWLETYATEKKDTDRPNSMWRRRIRGQLEKCAEAAALRSAYPEELGNEYAAEEMHGQTLAAGDDGIYRPQAEKAETEAAPAAPTYEWVTAEGEPRESQDADVAVAEICEALADALKAGGETALREMWEMNVSAPDTMKLLAGAGRNDLIQKLNDTMSALEQELPAETGAAEPGEASPASSPDAAPDAGADVTSEASAPATDTGDAEPAPHGRGAPDEAQPAEAGSQKGAAAPASTPGKYAWVFVAPALEGEDRHTPCKDVSEWRTRFLQYLRLRPAERTELIQANAEAWNRIDMEYPDVMAELEAAVDEAKKAEAEGGDQAKMEV